MEFTLLANGFVLMEKGKTMSKYVKLEEVIETVYQCRRAEANDEWIKRWLEPLNSLPTIDIVHCRECRHWRAYETWSMCELWTGDPYEAAPTETDGFCSYGERTEE